MAIRSTLAVAMQDLTPHPIECKQDPPTPIKMSTVDKKTFYPCNTQGCVRKTTKLTKEGVPYKYCFRCNENFRLTTAEDSVSNVANGTCQTVGCVGKTLPTKTDPSRFYTKCFECVNASKPYYFVSDAVYKTKQAHEFFLSLPNDAVIPNSEGIEEKLQELETYVQGIRSRLNDMASLSGIPPTKKQRTT